MQSPTKTFTHQNDGDMGEAIVSLADVREPAVVQENLLENEGGDGLGQLRAAFHNSQAERNNLSRQQEGDDFLFVCFHERADDSQAGETEVLEGPGLRRCVQEWIQEEWSVSGEEHRASLRVRRDILEQRQSVANPVGLLSGECRWSYRRVDVDDLLQKCSDCAYKVALVQHWMFVLEKNYQTSATALEQATGRSRASYSAPTGHSPWSRGCSAG